MQWLSYSTVSIPTCTNPLFLHFFYNIYLFLFQCLHSDSTCKIFYHYFLYILPARLFFCLNVFPIRCRIFSLCLRHFLTCNSFKFSRFTNFYFLHSLFFFFCISFYLTLNQSIVFVYRFSLCLADCLSACQSGCLWLSRGHYSTKYLSPTNICFRLSLFSCNYYYLSVFYSYFLANFFFYNLLLFFSFLSICLVPI